MHATTISRLQGSIENLTADPTAGRTKPTVVAGAIRLWAKSSSPWS